MTEQESNRQEDLLNDLHEERKEMKDAKERESQTKLILATEELQIKNELAGVEWQKVLDAKELKLAELDVRKQELEVERQKNQADVIKTGMAIGGTLAGGAIFAWLDAHNQYTSTAVKWITDIVKNVLPFGRKGK